jgi:hypothetical protein
MSMLLSGLPLAAALLCAGVMGLAIQRGGTCTVAAITELIRQRRAGRLLALVEASLWVAGGLLLMHRLGLMHSPALGYAANRYTVWGGALLGLGAVVNGACVFGAIARLGSGEWAFVATPIGFYLGCVSLKAVFAAAAPQPLASTSVVLQASPLWLLPFIAFVLWRGLCALFRGASFADLKDALHQAWSPHGATLVIGLSFSLLLLLAGSWAYTDALAEVARGMSKQLLAKCLLLLALYAGALAGGRWMGRWRGHTFDTTQLGRCLVGGALMAWGSLLIPGANDGLILIGMPLLWPYAWLAFGTMCLSITLALWALGLWRRAAGPVT